MLPKEALATGDYATVHRRLAREAAGLALGV